MEGVLLQWLAFAVLSVVAIAGALGMATTMSMFRSGVFLLASFVGAAGLYVLLAADLIGWLQVMMYVGGMLVMILFMLLFSHDPGGEMMTGMMELPPIARFFSRGLAHGGEEEEGGDGGDHGGGLPDGAKKHGGSDQGGGMGMQMDMEEMSMNTPIKKPAAVLGAMLGLLLLAMIAFRPAWSVVDEQPDPASAERIGDLLMGSYMMAFEGAGLLILLGIFGATYLARPDRFRDRPDRDRIRAAVDEPPAPLHDQDCA